MHKDIEGEFLGANNVDVIEKMEWDNMEYYDMLIITTKNAEVLRMPVGVRLYLIHPSYVGDNPRSKWYGKVFSLVAQVMFKSHTFWLLVYNEAQNNKLMVLP